MARGYIITQANNYKCMEACMTHIAMPREKEDGITKVLVKDMTAKELLREILFQLKKANIYLQLLSGGEKINEGDIQ